MRLIGEQSYAWYREPSTYGCCFFFFHPKTNMLHEVHRFDAGSLLASRPWPARQIIGVNEAVLADIIGGTPVTVAT